MRFFSWLLLLSLGAALPSCERSPVDSAASSETPPVEATWYNVPPDSLARRRAKAAELTAASDRYQLGTMLRVTRVSNGRAVVVRVTDTGLREHKSQIDLCKEAAAQLEMVSDGVAKVRLKVLSPPLKGAATATPTP